MSKHTPGPWEYRPIKNVEEISRIAPEIFTGKLVVARAYDPHGLSESQANARLIAAAPDTLKELKSLVARVQDILADGVDGFYRDALQSDLEPAEAAIAKAEVTS